MNGKILLALFLAMGIVMAIQPAESWVAGPQAKYTQQAIANVTTEGGNVTELNLTSNISTEKWAGFWGQTAGGIVLAPNNAGAFYTWAWTPADGGEVCAVLDNGFNWAGLSAATVAQLDSAWNFAVGDTDSATSTFTNAACTLNVAGSTVSTARALTLGGGNFYTCAARDGGTAKGDMAFCVGIQNNAALFNGGTGDYQLLTATNETAGQTENYNFWLELN